MGIDTIFIWFVLAFNVGISMVNMYAERTSEKRRGKEFEVFKRRLIREAVNDIEKGK